MATPPSGSVNSSPSPESQDPEIGEMATRERGEINLFDHVEQFEPQEGRNRKWLLVPVAAVGVFLAPITFISAMMAEHSDTWKPVFVGCFSGWIVILAFGIYIDLHRLPKAKLIKRSLWHLGSCILILYVIVSTTQPTADTLPQWIPLIIDCGLGMSIGIQNIPSNAREQLWTQLNELVGSFCGGVQVRLQAGHSTPHQLLAPNDAE